jgi:hypothetical protein
MNPVSKEVKRTRTRRHANNNNNANIKENRIDSRVRRHLKKKEEKITTEKQPVIGSSNPFFIAVCAPDTYKPASSVAPVMPTLNQRAKPNVFLRQRPRAAAASYSNSGSGGSSNRFIHHPVLQQSRHTTTGDPMAACSNVGGSQQPDIISSTDLLHFPSLRTNTDLAPTTAPAKLNFKEMMMRTAGGSPTTTTTESETPTPPPPTPTSMPLSNASIVGNHKILSSANIFLAAFRPPPENHEDVDDNDAGEYTGGGGGAPIFASSILVDSCDKKYDRLYR